MLDTLCGMGGRARSTASWPRSLTSSTSRTNPVANGVDEMKPASAASTIGDHSSSGGVTTMPVLPARAYGSNAMGGGRIPSRRRQRPSCDPAADCRRAEADSPGQPDRLAREIGGHVARCTRGKSSSSARHGDWKDASFGLASSMRWCGCRWARAGPGHRLADRLQTSPSSVGAAWRSIKIDGVRTRAGYRAARNPSGSAQCDFERLPGDIFGQVIARLLALGMHVSCRVSTTGFCEAGSSISAPLLVARPHCLLSPSQPISELSSGGTATYQRRSHPAGSVRSGQK